MVSVLIGTWSYAPGDSSCIGSLAAIFVIEILVAVGSLTVIMAVLRLWLRGWITGSIDFTTAAGETMGSSGVPVGTQEEPFDSSAAASAPKTRTFGDSGTEMSAASRTTRTGNVPRKESQVQVDVKEEGKDNTKREKEGVDNEIVCRIGPEGVSYQSVSKK
ncbi:hypothetical protein EMCRGX_G012266 [Ephydatia muelleri]